MSKYTNTSRFGTFCLNGLSVTHTKYSYFFRCSFAMPESGGVFRIYEAIVQAVVLVGENLEDIRIIIFVQRKVAVLLASLEFFGTRYGRRRWVKWRLVFTRLFDFNKILRSRYLSLSCYHCICPMHPHMSIQVARLRESQQTEFTLIWLFTAVNSEMLRERWAVGESFLACPASVETTMRILNVSTHGYEECDWFEGNTCR